MSSGTALKEIIPTLNLHVTAIDLRCNLIKAQTILYHFVPDFSTRVPKCCGLYTVHVEDM